MGDGGVHLISSGGVVLCGAKSYDGVHDLFCLLNLMEGRNYSLQFLSSLDNKNAAHAVRW